MEKLRECPFCGGKAEHQPIFTHLKKKNRFVVECANCGTRSGWYKTVNEVIKAWNTRVGEEND